MIPEHQFDFCEKYGTVEQVNHITNRTRKAFEF